MPSLTGPNQSSFIPSRLAADNVIVVQEIVDSLQRRKGRTGGMIAKIDLEKAYDRVDWNYLRKVLLVTEFSSSIQNLIMSIVSSTKLQVCWNGESLAAFTPSRGLSQGDPLSPYLFVLCMETLYFRIQRAVQNREWSLLQFVKGGTPLSHLFFANDLLLFGQASYSQTRVKEHILESFCHKSGQLMS